MERAARNRRVVEVLQHLHRAASAPGLVANVGLVRSEALSRRVSRCLECLVDPLDGLSQHEASALICDLSRECVQLASFDNVEPPDESAEDTDDLIWGFGLPVAEVVGLGLACAAELLPPLGCDEEQDSDLTVIRQTILSMLGELAFDMDCLSMHMYGSLCREASPRDDAKLAAALQGISVWLLTTLGRATGLDQITSCTLWELALGDALWASVLAKGVLSFATCQVFALPVPEDLALLQYALLKAVLGLPAADVAFLRESSTVTGNQVPIYAREASLAQHRAELALAAAECRLIETVFEAVKAAEPALHEELLCALVAFLAIMLRLQCVIRPNIEAATCYQLGPHSQDLWILLAKAVRPLGGRFAPAFLQDCAVLARVLRPPDPEALDHPELRQLLQQLAGNSCPSSAGAEVSATIAAPTTTTITITASAAATAAAAEVGGGPGPGPKLPSTGASAAEQRTDLRGLVKNAPPHLCCALDGKLLVDPVRSPQGLVFERGSLARALGARPGVCPLTGAPLELEACPRAVELRAQVTQWVRNRAPSTQRRCQHVPI
ncbi:unnamed protein product [Polarella glacialis]|uniref:U-box domain-containing protein n=1 Tax=Polarella glacialis TaxID=89957 RepID=A0A813GFV5_POLGL|nr:unnamed protein product [Polarella glacialis]